MTTCKTPVKLILTTLSAVTALTLSGIVSTAHADGFLKTGPSVFNYDNIDLTFIDADIFNGVGVSVSTEFKENYAIRVGYSQLEVEDADADALDLGVDYHIQSARYPRADWVFGAGLQKIDTELSDETGLDLRAGIRYAMTDALELSSSFIVQTVEDTDVGLNLTALYEITTGFSGLVQTNISDDSSLGLGLRFYWR